MAEPIAAKYDGDDELAPKLISLTITVPFALPSLFHSSVPVAASAA